MKTTYPMLTYTVATPNTQTKSNRLGTKIRLTYALTYALLTRDVFPSAARRRAAGGGWPSTNRVMETYTNKAECWSLKADRYTADKRLRQTQVNRDGQHNLGNNDRRKIGGCFNLWGHRTTTTGEYQSILKDITPTNQTKSNENKTDRHRHT